MKIAFRIERINYGGGERVILALAEAFRKKGFEIVLITHNQNLLSEKLPGQCFLICGNSNYRLGTILGTHKICSKEKIDILIQFGPDPYVALGTMLTNTKLLYSLRVDPREIKSFLQWAVKITHLCASGIVFQTATVQNYYNKFVRRKSIVIPNPILDDLIPISQKRKKRIVGIGRLADQKNFSLLIEAVSKIDLKDYTVHIYGKGENEIKLKEQIAKLGLADVVFLEGYVSNTIEAIKDAEIFVLSSNSEGMPNALIEAMCMKLACISTDVPSGGTRCLIDNNNNGIIVPVNSVNSLAEALQFLLNNEKARQKYAEEAYKIRERLNKDKIIDRWVEYIESFI